MRLDPNADYRGPRAWRLPQTRSELLSWVVVILGGVILIAVTKGIVPAILMIAVCGGLIVVRLVMHR